MVEVDRVTIEEFGVELIQMMENAGRSLAHLARARFLDGDPQDKAVVVLAGSGGNGGGAMVCARRLSDWGAQVGVFLSRPESAFAKVPRQQLRTLEKIGVDVVEGALPPTELAPDLIIDGLIGYSLHGAPRGAAADLIRWANGAAAPTLALDAPSGVDTTTGTTFDPTIQAAATLTLALPKSGLEADVVGELYLADIGIPPAVYSSLGIEVGPLFATTDILHLV
jgi:NAD(P)H-hydrate epimerase